MVALRVDMRVEMLTALIGDDDDDDTPNCI